MKGIVIIVLVVLISCAYGLDYCKKDQKENDTCGSNGKCRIPTCIDEGATTTTTTTTAATTTTATTTGKTLRKRRTTTGQTVAVCTTTCEDNQVCVYTCTGESSGSIKHGVAPLALLVGVLTILFVVG